MKIIYLLMLLLTTAIVAGVGLNFTMYFDMKAKERLVYEHKKCLDNIDKKKLVTDLCYAKTEGLFPYCDFTTEEIVRAVEKACPSTLEK